MWKIESVQIAVFSSFDLLRLDLTFPRLALAPSTERK
jgi:hypothetical protein